MYFHVGAVYDIWNVKYVMTKYNENLSSDILSLFLKAQIFYTLQMFVWMSFKSLLYLPTVEYKIVPCYLLQ
jgi:hypothetical protein